MADEIEKYAVSLYSLSEAEGIPLRLFGSCAIRIKCAKHADILDQCNRHPKDIDCVIRRASRNRLRAVLLARGWQENVELTAQNDGRRLQFKCSNQNIILDVSVDVLRFAQTLDVRKGFELDGPTLPAADLLLSKLQIRNLTPSDLIDMIALLHAVPIDSADGIEVQRIVEITSRSWRWYKSVMVSFPAINRALAEPICNISKSDRDLVGSRLRLLESRIFSAPKTIWWKVRSFFGEMLPWYDSVEV